MTQLFDENGKVVPVTVVEAGPCAVVQKKTVESDGYVAVQLGYGDISAKKASKTRRRATSIKRTSRPSARCVSSAWTTCSAMNVGDIIKADVFAVGDRVDVVGTSKGKGYAGAIKRYGTSTVCSETHGTGPVARHAGSMGSCSTPSRVFKGKTPAGPSWAPSASPSRTSRSSRLTQKII